MSAAILPTFSETIPVNMNADGVALIGNSRITLDTIVTVFIEGATPEQIMDQFPTLKLADIYSVISYYLKNKKEVDPYLSRRQNIIDQVRKHNQSRFASNDIKKRLLARQTNT